MEKKKIKFMKLLNKKFNNKVLINNNNVIIIINLKLSKKNLNDVI